MSSSSLDPLDGLVVLIHLFCLLYGCTCKSCYARHINGSGAELLFLTTSRHYGPYLGSMPEIHHAHSPGSMDLMGTEGHDIGSEAPGINGKLSIGLDCINMKNRVGVVDFMI